MFLALISMFASLEAAAPVQQDSIVLYAYWNNHETKKFEIVVENEKYNDDGTSEIDSVWSLNQLEVIDSTADKYTIRWTTLDQKFAGSETYRFMENNQSLIPKNVPLIYEITTIGNFVRLVNIQEIKNSYLALMDSVTNALFTNEQKEIAGKALAPFTNDDYIQQTFSSVFTLIHQFYGYRYALDQEYEFATTMPNFLTGDKMAASGTLYVSELDTIYSAVELVETIEPDSIALKTSIAAYLRGFVKDLGETEKQEFEKNITGLSLTLIDERTYNYDVYSGWMNYYYSVRDVYANGKLSQRMVNYIQLL